MKMKQNELITVEGPNGRTYGECAYAEISSIHMINGVFTSTLYIKDKPKRLSRELALLYYTKKLRMQWDKLFQIEDLL